VCVCVCVCVLFCVCKENHNHTYFRDSDGGCGGVGGSRLQKQSSQIEPGGDS